jgi:predicted ATPase
MGGEAAANASPLSLRPGAKGWSLKMDGNYISGVKLTKPLPEGSYLRGLPAVRHLVRRGGLSFDKPVTFLVGENGTGKSALLEGIAAAYGFNPEGGTKNFTFSTRATHSELYRHLTLVRRAHAKDGFFLRAESFYNLASNIDDLGVEESYGGRSLHAQSHGESFFALIENRFGGDGLYCSTSRRRRCRPPA